MIQATKPERLGDLLLEAGEISPDELAAALRVAQRDGIHLGQALIHIGVMDENAIAAALDRQGKIPCIRLYPPIIEPATARRLDRASWIDLDAIAVNEIGGVVTVAMADPKNLVAIDAISRALRGRIFPVFAERTAILECIDALCRDPWQETNVAGRVGPPGASHIDAPAVEREETRPEDGSSTLAPPPVAATAPTTAAGSGDSPEQTFTELIRKCHLRGATCIHLDSSDDGFRARLRVDGRLVEFFRLSQTWAKPTFAHIQRLVHEADLGDEISREGRVRLDVGHGLICELMVVIPNGANDDQAVIHLIEAPDWTSPWQAMGDEGDELTRVLREGYGLILLSSPTSVGLDGALTCAVRSLSRDRARRVAVVRLRKGDDAPLALRERLHRCVAEDSDTVVIRDPLDDPSSTGDIVRAAMGGQLVLAALAAPDAAAATQVLRTFGVESSVIAGVLRAVVAKGSVRRLCDDCREPAMSADPRDLARLGLPPNLPTFTSAGCDACDRSGSRGRVELTEILRIERDIADVVRGGGDAEAVRSAAERAGVHTARRQAIRLIEPGITSLEAALACARQDHHGGPTA